MAAGGPVGAGRAPRGGEGASLGVQRARVRAPGSTRTDGHPAAPRSTPPPPRATQDLVDWALEQHDLRGTIDNVTVVVCVFK
jgi:hypothetical protein